MRQLQGPPRIARLQSSQLAVDGVDFRVEALGPIGSVGEEHGAQHPVANLNNGKFRRRARLQTPIEDHRVADRAHDEADPEEREKKEPRREAFEVERNLQHVAPGGRGVDRPALP